MKKIYVTKPSLPKLEEFMPYLEEIWQSKMLTNFGPFNKRFESKLCRFLDLPYTSLLCNGTIALQVAMQALRVSGEIITTPFTFAATAHAIYWNHCKPVFCDIDPTTLNIDARKIEALITPQTSAILPVHVYGIPCDIDNIQKVANIHGLKVIYDAAHAFGVNWKGKSLFNHGDLSIASFHATKVLNTFEGGAIFLHDKVLKQRIDYLINFGYASETKVIAPGINGKMNEFQAALGLLQLEYFLDERTKSKKVWEHYFHAFAGINGIRLVHPSENVEWNYSYCAVLFDSSVHNQWRDEIYESLRKNNVFARRYFYPLISECPTYGGMSGLNSLPHAWRISREILCLPMYPDLETEEQERIINIVLDSVKGK